MINVKAPDRLFPELFELVQSRQLFADSKTFVDAIPTSHPDEVMQAYNAGKDEPGFDLAAFVEAHFELPAAVAEASSATPDMPVEQRIDQLWDQLTRAADETTEHSSLIPLPRSYVVPGGRFREVYYWDSYFTMLGLAESGRAGRIADMVENFAWLVDRIGFIPNGNRSYYCSRSQPPFFHLMVDLLSEATSAPDVRRRYQPQLVREYAFWMDGAATLADGQAHRRVIAVGDGFLNRYWDDADTPRLESYVEDVELATATDRDPAGLYRDVRAAAESGWDFSSRWFADRKTMASIRTTDVVPVELNALLCNLESMIAANYRADSDGRQARLFEERADRRGNILRSMMFDDETGMFVDLLLPDLKPTGTLSLAAAFPLFLRLATPEQAARVARRIDRDFRKQGGWVTTLEDTGQQWDSPNGWAPLQWITFCGLERYGFADEAAAGARRWVRNNLDVYHDCGRLLEKYDVVSAGHGSGGEYAVQDGFGWTNGVLLRLMHELKMKAHHSQC